MLRSGRESSLGGGPCHPPRLQLAEARAWGPTSAVSRGEVFGIWSSLCKLQLFPAFGCLGLQGLRVSSKPVTVWVPGVTTRVYTMSLLGHLNDSQQS